VKQLKHGKEGRSVLALPDVVTTALLVEVQALRAVSAKSASWLELRSQDIVSLSVLVMVLRAGGFTIAIESNCGSGGGFRGDANDHQTQQPVAL
jgi:hypothetical protein